MKSEKWLLLTMISLAGLVYSIITEDNAANEDDTEDQVEDEAEETESAYAETGI